MSTSLLSTILSVDVFLWIIDKAIPALSWMLGKIKKLWRRHNKLLLNKEMINRLKPINHKKLLL